jgi:hypothetical protein
LKIEKQNTGWHKNQAKNSTCTPTHACLSRSREQQGSPPALAKKIKNPLKRENRPGETLLLAAGKIKLHTREPKPRKHQENEVQSDLSGEEDKSFGSRHKNQR